MSDRTRPAPALVGELDLPPRPYPGLRAFTPGEWPVFFGRETMAEAVMRRLQRHRLVVVHGGSGSGKSSLIFAEVLPQLQRRRHRQGARLAICSMRPGSTPLRALAATLHGLAADAGARSGGVASAVPKLEDLRVILARGRLAAGDLESVVVAAGYDQLCLYVDQFEEVFRYTPESDDNEARLFAEVVVGLAGPDPEDVDFDDDAGESGLETAPAEPPRASEGARVAPPRICAVVTVRSEFLGDCARYSDLAEAVNRTQYLLPKMKRPDLLRAIREPAALFGGSVQWELADRLVRDAAREEDPLPLLQHALMCLWNNHAPHLTLGHYDEETLSRENDRGSAFRSGLGQMLATHADQALAAAVRNNKERHAVAQHIFRALTDVDREGRAVRREQRLDRLRAVADPAGKLLIPIIDDLRADGVSFLRPSPTEQAVLTESDDIDISHEALIRSWPRLAESAAGPTGRPHGWLHREFQEGLAWRALAARALEFQKQPELVLPPATTESRWPWFEAVRQRPAWALRHLIAPVPGLPIEQQPEWLAVTKLVEASQKVYLEQLDLLDHETKLRGEAQRRETELRSQRNHWLFPALLALLAIVAILWYKASNERDVANEQRQNAEEALGEARRAALAAQNARDQAQWDFEQRLADIASSLQAALPRGPASSAALEVISRDLHNKAPSQTQSDEVAETPTAAALQVTEKVRASDPAQVLGIDGFMWIGSATQPRLADPNDDRLVKPEAVQPGSQYRVTHPTVLRQDMPTEDSYRTAESIGFVIEGSLIQVLGSPKGYDRLSGTQYWVRLRVQPDQEQIAAGYRAAALDALLSHQVEPAIKALANADSTPWLKRLKKDADTLRKLAAEDSQNTPWSNLYKDLARDEAFLAGIPSELVNRLKSTIGTETPARQATVWLQFAGASRDQAQKIADNLKKKDYLVPGEERRPMKTGLREIRFFYPGDEPLARQLATEVSAVLKKLGYKDHDIVVQGQGFTTNVNKPRPGFLELWLDLPQR